METTWKALVLAFPPIPGRADGLPALSVDEAVTEALESDGAALQNMAASKVVAARPEFRDAVAAWQKRLGGVDATLAAWTDAQRKWSALESIFCGSADIRAQLPQESAAFDAVNEEFKVRMQPRTTFCALL